MPDGDIVGLVITSVLGLPFVFISIFLISGKGPFLIAVYNTLPKEEKEKYDSKKLCRFMGKSLLPIGIFTSCSAIGGIYKIEWIHWVYVLGVIALVIFALIYCNTGNRFRK